MKEIPVSVGKTYAVTTAGSCTVTDADGRELCTAESGSQSYFTANGHAVTLSDDAATVTQVNFKQALAALSLLGGGEKLPAGYARIEFLESTGQQYIDTNYIPTSSTGVRATIYTNENIDYVPFGSRTSSSTDSRFTVARIRCLTNTSRNGGVGWGQWVLFDRYNSDEINEVEFEGTTNWLDSGYAQIIDKLIDLTKNYKLPPLSFKPELPLYIFSCNIGGASSSPLQGKIYNAGISEGKKVIRTFIPAIGPAGVPCMYDLLTRKPFNNNGSGSFIAGIKDAAQLRTVLRKLPDLTGQDMGTLTLSIPAEANTPEIQEQLDTSEARKNWELTIQERVAGAATYSLRRVRKVVWVRRVPTENGSYVDADGSRWQAEWCSAIYSPRGNDPALHGYEPFDSVEQAIEQWGLAPYEYPDYELSTID